ncbi:uncharacterized protein LOC126893686 isoform X2 [Daktulosphaira vitifoliae]|uniref:uncharacterized protein LOC126893686 isoform X2 n=1 Tax=Daktulosphaira vitifoliae TaxID=58002 RepID=UPI0021A9F60F|nr:uncharacterized protein LOC126893686 isoform X2 [Daktulosphaira vitifoliae]
MIYDIIYIFGAATYAEIQGNDLFDSEIIDGDMVTLLSPTKPRDFQNTSVGLFENKTCDLFENEHHMESCNSFVDLRLDQKLCKTLLISEKNSEEDLLLFE